MHLGDNIWERFSLGASQQTRHVNKCRFIVGPNIKSAFVQRAEGLLNGSFYRAYNIWQLGPHQKHGVHCLEPVESLMMSEVDKWNEWGFRPLLCTYRLNWARRTSAGWWDEWDDTALQKQDSEIWGRACYLSVTEVPRNIKVDGRP